MTDKRKPEQIRNEELDDIRAVMNMESGRRFMSRLLGRARIFESCYAGSTNDTMFHEGERNIGLFILSEIDEACPQRTIEMMRESYERNRDTG